MVSENITWTISPVSRVERASRFGHRGAVIWFTGLSGAGKSTVATGLDVLLNQRGMAGFLLDGDNLRHGLCSNLGFSTEDRIENIRRAGEAARLMAEAGLVVICSLISPFRADRQSIRENCGLSNVPFAEIYINASLEVCESRDPKGLYKKARAGQIREFTGISSPYEPPENPEVNLHTDTSSIEASVKELADYVVALCRLPDAAR